MLIESQSTNCSSATAVALPEIPRNETVTGHRVIPSLESAPRRSKAWVSLLVLLGVWGVSAIYLGGFLYRGWVSHDEGLLAHTAERVLQGELPHQDFDDTYTGGLAYFHALAFRCFGIKLTSIRLMFFLVTLLFVPALFVIAVRSVSPWIAGLITLVCIAWSVPNYFAALPSWYVLYLTTFGIVALLQYLDTHQRRWLVVAGFCGGLGLIIKITALYYIAGAMLFLAYHEQRLSRRVDCEPLRGRSFVMPGLVLVAGGVLSTLLVRLVWKHLGPMEVVVYVLPVSTMAGVIVWGEWRDGQGGASFRLRRLGGMVLPFLAAVLVPVMCFVLPYVVNGSLERLYYGIFVLPSKRIELAASSLPPLGRLWYALPGAAVLFTSFRRTCWLQAIWMFIVTLLVALYLLAGSKAVVYQAMWFSVWSMAPFVVLVTARALMRFKDWDIFPEHRRQEIYLLSVMAAFMALVQYPFAAPIYFCYSVPLMILAILFVVSSQPWAPRKFMAGMAVSYLVLAVLWVNPGPLRSLGFHYEPYPARAKLAFERGGLFLEEEDARHYAQLIQEIEKHTPPGSCIYAAPDCTEVYFLSQRANPTRTMYDIFDDPANRTAQLMDLLDEKQVDLVVINLKPEFSHPIEGELAAFFKARYPQAVKIGPFVVAWREPSPAATPISKL